MALVSASCDVVCFGQHHKQLSHSTVGAARQLDLNTTFILKIHDRKQSVHNPEPLCNLTLSHSEHEEDL